MVMARLHVICGNCGCNDEFTLEVVRDGNHHHDDTFSDAVYVSCRNCSTLHNLDNVMPRRRKEKP